MVKDSEGVAKSSIYGPIAALDISSTGYDYNTNSDNDCGSSNDMSRLGFMAKNANVQGDIYGGILTENGTFVTTSQNNRCAPHSPFHPISRSDDLASSLWSFAPSTIKKTSRKLASFDPDTFIGDDKSLISSTAKRSFKGYRILKLPACSDLSCASVDTNKEITTDVLKSGIKQSGPFKDILPNEMVVFNVIYGIN